MNQIIDVLIVGAGPAGLSAALTLARGGRSVLVCDNGSPRNARASHMQNFPSQDGTPPAEFRQQIKDDLKKYTAVKILNVGVESIKKELAVFQITLTNKEIVTAKKLILAHGVRDVLPEIKGIQDIFGKSLFFCPYCHGYEHTDSPIALIANNLILSHMATVILGLTKDLKVFTNGDRDIDQINIDFLKKNNVELITDEISEFITDKENLKAIKLKNGKIIPRNFVFTKPHFELSSPLGVNLGCELTEHGIYKVDDFGKTSVPGVYAIGDIATMRHSVLSACALGQFTAAALNFEIMHELLS